MAGVQKTNSKFDVNALRQHILHLKSKLSSANQKFDDQVQINHDLISDLEDLRQSVVSKLIYNEALEKNKTIAENNAELTRQNGELIKKAEAQQQTEATLEADISRILTEKLTLQQDIANLKIELVQVRGSHKEATEDYQQVSVLKSDLQVAVEKLNSLEAENKKLFKKNQSLGDLNQYFAEEIENSAKYNCKISKNNDALKNEIKELIIKTKKLECKNSVLQKDKQHVACNSQEEIRKLQNTLRGFQVRSSDKDLDKLRKDHETLKNNLKSERANFKQELQSESTALKVAKFNNDELNKKVETLQKQLADQEVELEKKSKLIAEIRKKEQRTDAAVKLLRVQVDSMKAERETLILKHDMARKFDSVKHEQFVENSKKLECENENLKKQLQENAVLILTQKEEMSRQQLDIDLTKKDLAEQEKHAKKMQDEAKGKDAKVKELEQDAKLKYDMLKQLEEQLKTITAHTNNLKSQLKECELDNSKLKWELNEEKSRIVTKVDPDQRKFLQNKQEIAAANANINWLEEELEKCKSYNFEARFLTERLKRERNDLQAELRDLKSQALPEKIAELKQSLEAKSRKLEVANENIDSLEEKLDGKLKEIRELKKDLRKYESSLTYLSFEMAALKPDNENLRSVTPVRNSGKRNEFCDETRYKKARKL